MEIKIIDTPRTVTVADIAPGQQFRFLTGDSDLYLRINQCEGFIGVNLTHNLLLSADLNCIVEPCEPPTPATCTFGELNQGDLFRGTLGPGHRYIKIRADEAFDLDDNRVIRGGDVCIDVIVTPLEQVEPLVLRTRR